jgi:hypothetical protein
MIDLPGIEISNYSEHYSETPLVYDCFMFFNELDLLEIRLNTLSSSVDYFLLIEADRTFSSKESPEQAPGYLRFLLEIFAYVGNKSLTPPVFRSKLRGIKP